MVGFSSYGVGIVLGFSIVWFCSVVVAGACGLWVWVWVGWICCLGVGSLDCMLIGLLWLPFGWWLFGCFWCLRVLLFGCCGWVGFVDCSVSCLGLIAVCLRWLLAGVAFGFVALLFGCCFVLGVCCFAICGYCLRWASLLDGLVCFAYCFGWLWFACFICC